VAPAEEIVSRRGISSVDALVAVAMLSFLPSKGCITSLQGSGCVRPSGSHAGRKLANK
jgi:hypothetical protein